ncbi:peptidoglycan-associated lipoprotein Pal [Fontisphaera persica]|uniref:peptidoglycan-associated lipoprotein Pal n=1 Tax=Fontisphaera persica TaxID=2974023 RepID=UPI0024BF621D|nr:peptidoglycan-associated lipoprotein Pal [Fontisphaera persica]WCJ59059.1 peptidoglycan-associated lipoprotein Pal [Fontisphaera persica]
MNRLTASIWLSLGLALIVLLGEGCRRRPTALTYIPGHSRSVTNELAGLMDDAGRAAQPPGSTGTGLKPGATDVGSIPLPDRSRRENMNEDREYFKNQTVYFDFDKSAVRASERGKVQAVAEALKKRPEASVEVEGHCDERGTEEYNRSLGERRALSIREYLILLGISSERIFTVSFGEDKPAVPGHNEAAWSKNRRGEFILLTPKP